MDRGQAQIEEGEIELLENGDIPSGLLDEDDKKATMRVSGQVDKTEIAEGQFKEEQTGTVEGQTEASTTVKSPAKRTKSEAPAAKASKPTIVYRTEEQRAKIMALGGWDEYDFIGVCIARFDPNGNNQFKSDNQITAATADLWIAELEMAAALAEKKDAEEFDKETEDIESAGDGDYLPEEKEDKPFVAKAGVVYHSKKNTDIPKATLIKKEKGGE